MKVSFYFKNKVDKKLKFNEQINSSSNKYVIKKNCNSKYLVEWQLTLSISYTNLSVIFSFYLHQISERSSFSITQKWLSQQQLLSPPNPSSAPNQSSPPLNPIRTLLFAVLLSPTNPSQPSMLLTLQSLPLHQRPRFPSNGPSSLGRLRRPYSSQNIQTKFCSIRSSIPSKRSRPLSSPARPGAWRISWVRPPWGRRFFFRVGIVLRASRNSMPTASVTRFV